jgi:hypothetical protein
LCIVVHMTCRILRFHDGGSLSNYITIFWPRDMQEYIFMFSIALEWTVNLICDHQIFNWCREIFKYNTVISWHVGFYEWKELEKCIYFVIYLYVFKLVCTQWENFIRIGITVLYLIWIWRLQISENPTCHMYNNAQ